MKISQNDLHWAVSQELLSASQADALLAALRARHAERPQFDLPHVIYYLGALIVIGSMTWFMTQAWEDFGGVGIFLIATAYAVCFLAVGRFLWNRTGLRIPGGLLATMAVCMAPLAIYGFQRMIGIWPQEDPGTYSGFYTWVKGGWFLMETGTIAAGLLALRFFRFPFLTAPIAFSLWYMSMDVTPLLYGKTGVASHELYWVSIWFGLAMLVLAFIIDRRTREDYSFWGYLFGLTAFWGGLSLLNSDSELAKFIYCLINVFLMLCSVLLRRRVFIIFGALGVTGYLGHLANRLFEDSLFFPFALSILGLAVIGIGLLYQRHRTRIEDFILSHTPSLLLRCLPRERD
jgi:hypothetical protein